MKPTGKTKVRRAPQRGHYDKETVYRILDRDFICQIGFVHEGYPVVIPTIYGRKDNSIYIHGASVSRMIVELEKGVPISINVTQTNGIVLARSAFHHSLNYESVTIFGTAHIVNDEQEKVEALKIISDQIIPKRWEEVRPPNFKELKATKVLKIEIEEASAKIRTGDPSDEKQDYDLDVWSGVIPIQKVYGEPIADALLKEGIAVSLSAENLIKK